MKKKKTASFESILKGLRQQMRGRRKIEDLEEDSQGKPRMKSSLGQILVLLFCVAASFILLSTQFDIGFLEVVLLTVLIAMTAGLLFYFIYRRGNR